MKYFLTVTFAFLIIACSTKREYEVSRYYDKSKQDSVLVSIINYIFIAPPYTLMKDRFESKHRQFYTNQKVVSQFYIHRYHVAADSTNYFFVIRSAPKIGEKRGVGGYFKKVNKDYKLLGFREVFVTPILSEKDAKAKGEFLFDKMVKGDIQEYLNMKSYVQWPNEASYYDTTKYEWVLNKEKIDN